jgi:regulator of cell morphogenesis and NO signaling
MGLRVNYYQSLIARIKMKFANQTVGDLVAADFRKAEVFKRHGIDFCCGGGRTVAVACEKKGVSQDELEQELTDVEERSNSTEELDFNSWNTSKLVDYILYAHHSYIRENIPLLRGFTEKVARVHGHANPELVEIRRLFDEMATDLEHHMMKEEQILFPWIKKMDDPGALPSNEIQGPIHMMEEEHEHAGAVMAEIRRLSNNYTPPEHACTTYRVSFAKLEEFEADLHKHVHLENNILFPKAASGN